MSALFKTPKVVQQQAAPVATRDETQMSLDAADRLRRRSLGGRFGNILTRRKVRGATVTGGGAATGGVGGSASAGGGTGAGSGGSAGGGSSGGGGNGGFGGASNVFNQA